MSRETAPPSQPPAGRGARVFTIFLTVACLALAVEVLLLVQKNRRLREALAQANAARRPANIAVGEAFDELPLIDESGEETVVEFGEGQPRTLMLVFTPACPACARTFPFWGEVIPAEDTPGLRVVAVRLDRAAEPIEVSEAVLPFAIYSPADAETPLRKVTSVPTTLLLDEFGVVEKVWTGIFTAEREQDFRDTLAALPHPHL